MTIYGMSHTRGRPLIEVEECVRAHDIDLHVQLHTEMRGTTTCDGEE